MIEIGSKAPDFTLNSHFGVPFTLSEFVGKRHVLLVFYPLDWTPT
jgi:peroxiredoxin Q/BCP